MRSLDCSLPDGNADIYFYPSDAKYQYPDTATSRYSDEDAGSDNADPFSHSHFYQYADSNSNPYADINGDGSSCDKHAHIHASSSYNHPDPSIADQHSCGSGYTNTYSTINTNTEHSYFNSTTHKYYTTGDVATCNGNSYFYSWSATAYQYSTTILKFSDACL